jgi:hypothetical protein
VLLQVVTQCLVQVPLIDSESLYWLSVGSIYLYILKELPVVDGVVSGAVELCQCLYIHSAQQDAESLESIKEDWCLHIEICAISLILLEFLAQLDILLDRLVANPQEESLDLLIWNGHGSSVIQWLVHLSD